MGLTDNAKCSTYRASSIRGEESSETTIKWGWRCVAWRPQRTGDYKASSGRHSFVRLPEEIDLMVVDGLHSVGQIGGVSPPEPASQLLFIIPTMRSYSDRLYLSAPGHAIQPARQPTWQLMCVVGGVVVRSSSLLCIATAALLNLRLLGLFFPPPPPPPPWNI